MSDILSNMFSLSGKVAMVTGGNRGIGNDIAMGLAAAGADIYVVANITDGIDEMSDKLKAMGRKFGSHIADLSKENDAMAAVDKCVATMGKIDILVNNAGMIIREPLLEGKNENWQKVIDLNLSSIYYLSKTAAIHMKKQGNGKIINIASLLAFQGGVFVPSYAASKHGVAGLTKSFCNELANTNIQINAIAPGYIETDNTAQIRADKARYDSILSRIPDGRWGQVTDLVGGAIFLSSNAANYVNGHVLVIDGGWMAR